MLPFPTLIPLFLHVSLVSLEKNPCEKIKGSRLRWEGHVDRREESREENDGYECGEEEERKAKKKLGDRTSPEKI